MKKERGFTLIELLAVIIILGIIMLIAIPSVTRYINESRKQSYIDTAKQILKGAIPLINSGELDMYDTNTTYYIPAVCIETENSLSSPFGDFTEAYIGATYGETGYTYYWISTDTAGQGIKNVTRFDKLDKGLIESNIDSDEIQQKINKTSILGKRNIMILKDDCVSWNEVVEASNNVDETGELIEDAYIENPVYWALQDNDSNGTYETLSLSNTKLTGGLKGVFSGNTEFTTYSQVPWLSCASSALSTNNLSKDVTNIDVIGDIYPLSTAYWFAAVGFNTTTSFTANLSKLHTDNVTNMKYMFYDSGRTSSSWEINGLNNFNTSKVTNMSHMFCNAAGSTNNISLNLSRFDTSNVTNMESMFSSFGRAARTYNISGLNNFNVSKVKSMRYMFERFLSSANSWSFDFSGWNTSSLTDVYEMFYNAAYDSKSVYLNVRNWDMSHVTSFNYLFYEFGHTSTNSWRIVGLDTWDTSNVTDMTRVFDYAGWHAPSISINLSTWNTSKVTSMSGMFSDFGYWADSWSIGNISNWDVSNVTNMNNMFRFAGGSSYSLNINLKNWNTSKVTDMGGMFNCAGNYSNYVYIDISGFDMSKVTNIRDMFGAYWNTRYYTWRVTIPKTNGLGVNNTTTVINGKNTSFDITSDMGLDENNARFTLAR